MACEITKGRLDYSCMNIIGGLKNLYVAAYDSANFSSVDASGKVTITAATDIFKFELVNDGNTFDESNEFSRDAGTSTFTQTGNFILKGQDAASKVALEELSKVRTQIIVEDNMGNMRVGGLEFGGNFTVATNSGGAIADMNGYTLAFTAVATGLAPFIDDISGATEGAVIDPNA